MKDAICNAAKKKMEGVLGFFTKEVSGLRAGRASLSLLEDITVDYYGSKMPVSQIATITIPQPQLIIIQPWDKTMINGITKAIQGSNLGLNPISDATVIKVPVPPLSEERRTELVKILEKMGEEAKVEIREIRRKENDELKKAEKNKQVSEDDMYKGIDEIQKITDRNISEIEKKVESRKKDIMEG